MMKKPCFGVQNPVQSNEQRLFDERQRIPHSYRAMRLLGMSLMLASLSVAALAQTNTPGIRKVSLEDCVQSALEKNLDVRIARYNPPQALADLQAAYAGWNPTFNLGGAHNYQKSGGGFDPTLGVITYPNSADQNTFNSSLGGLTPWGLNYSMVGNLQENYGNAGPNAPFDTSSGSAILKLSQPLLKNFWIDQTRFNIQVGKNRVKYTDLGLKQTVMNLATAVEQAYYDLIYARENVTVQEKAVELAMQLVAENKKRVEVGSLAPLDEKQAEAQAASSQAALISARGSLVLQENTVKQLISDNYAVMEPVDLQPTAPLNAPVRVFDRQISWSKGLTDRPDLLQAKLDVQRQGITIKYNYNQLFPELDITGGYGLSANVPRGDLRQAENEIGRGNLPSHSYGGQLTYPIGNTAARANYKKSKLGMEQLVLNLKKLEQTIMVTIDNDITQAKSSYQQVAATRAAREYAKEALEAEQKKLENGKSTTYTVLQMQRDLTTARGNEIQALANYNKALAQLSLDEGTTLQRLSINVEVK
jgi:outer membrane protein TolC